MRTRYSPQIQCWGRFVLGWAFGAEMAVAVVVIVGSLMARDL